MWLDIDILSLTDYYWIISIRRGNKMGQMDNVTKLSWILDFAQTEWDNLSKEEKDIINIRLSHLFKKMFREVRDDGSLYSKLFHLFKKFDLFKEEEIISIQTQLKMLFSELLKTRESWPSGGVFTLLPPVRKALAVSDDGHYEILRLPGKPAGPIRDIQIKSLKVATDLDYGPAIIDYVAESLKSLPKDTIKRCAECQKLFLHVSKKKKIYCSSACAWKRLSRLRRDALKQNPKKYKAFLKKQKETMRKYYEKRRKAGEKVKHRKEV